MPLCLTRINNCVGEGNQWVFMQLVLWAFAMSGMALVMNVMNIWYLDPCINCDKVGFLTLFCYMY